METDKYTSSHPKKENTFFLGKLHEAPLLPYHNGQQEKTHKAKVPKRGKVNKPSQGCNGKFKREDRNVRFQS